MIEIVLVRWIDSIRGAAARLNESWDLFDSFEEMKSATMMIQSNESNRCTTKNERNLAQRGRNVVVL
jgi:hypothetical protein